MMQIGILGTGEVGRTLATGFAQAGHDVMIAGRTQARAAEQTREVESAGLQTGAFADAAAFAELVVLSVSGSVAVDVLRSVSAQVSGKVVIDTTNPLSFPDEKPMQLLVANTDSTAEQLQRAVPDARIVKALNMMNSKVMIEPTILHGQHVACIAGDDAIAKRLVEQRLRFDFGWSDIIDLGDITAARGMECWMHLWLKLWGSLGTAQFNIGIVR